MSPAPCRHIVHSSNLFSSFFDFKELQDQTCIPLCVHENSLIAYTLGNKIFRPQGTTLFLYICQIIYKIHVSSATWTDNTLYKIHRLSDQTSNTRQEKPPFELVKIVHVTVKMIQTIAVPSVASQRLKFPLLKVPHTLDTGLRSNLKASFLWANFHCTICLWRKAINTQLAVAPRNHSNDQRVKTSLKVQ